MVNLRFGTLGICARFSEHKLGASIGKRLPSVCVDRQAHLEHFWAQQVRNHRAPLAHCPWAASHAGS